MSNTYPQEERGWLRSIPTKSEKAGASQKESANATKRNSEPVDSEPRQQTGHTPIPWKIEHEESTTGQFVICNHQNQYVCHGEPWIERLADQGLLNAELIVRAVNSHQSLLEAAKKMLAFYNDMAKSNPGFMGKLALQDYAQWNDVMTELPAAIKQAQR